MDESKGLTTSYKFRGVEYVVSVGMEDDKTLMVEVEDKHTADQWSGTFDASYIEDLTHKTGNFKQFSIFASMLESALEQTSDSVSLDLLTYTDLESLRNRKSGSSGKGSGGSRSTNLSNKRYLILTYTVEFDRIHYPLPLPYVGKPDPRALQKTIRDLKQEVKVLKQHGTRDSQQREMEKLKKEFEALLQEKEDLEADFIDYKRQVQNTSKGAAAKEIRILKGVVKNLEEELMTEKTKHQRSSSKRNQEYRQLADEVEELRASERNLRVRVKSLTNELAVYKRDRGRPLSTTQRRSTSRDNSRSNSLVRNGASSRENSFSREHSRLSSRENSRLSQGSRDSRSSFPRSSFLRNTTRDRSLSRDRSLTRDKPVGRSSSLTRGRTNSRDRNTTLRNRSSSRESVSSVNRERPWSRDKPLSARERNIRDRSTSRERSYLSSNRQRSPSPSAAGCRSPRFDPTAFIKEKQRKKKETELKMKRQMRSKFGGGVARNNQRPPSRNSSVITVGILKSRISREVGSFRSRSSSIDSLSDIVGDTDASDARFRKGSNVLSQRRNSNGWSSPDVSYSKPPPAVTKDTKILASTPENGKFKTQSRISKENIKPRASKDLYDRTDEISEIDARLNRLQQFIKANVQ